MKEKELFPIEDIVISEEEMPTVVSSAIDAIVCVDENIKAANIRCQEAKEKVGKLIVAKAGKTKDAINSTQDAVKAISEAQVALAEVQTLLFEQEQKLAEGMRYLLILGTSSIAMNRLVIAQLEEKLKRASEEELSVKAREELLGVIRLLREQESAFSRQDRMSEEIDETKKVVRIHAAEIMHIHQVDKQQDETDAKHDQQIAAGVKKDEEQDEEIQRQRKVDAEHDAELKRVKMIAIAGVCLAAIAIMLAIWGIVG